MGSRAHAQDIRLRELRCRHGWKTIILGPERARVRENVLKWYVLYRRLSDLLNVRPNERERSVLEPSYQRVREEVPGAY